MFLCGKPYVANCENSSTVIEIEVEAHARRIVRPRWRRGCDCASSPLEVSAPPVPRLFLFPRTPYGTSVWACFLYERYAYRLSRGTLHRVSAWMSDQGLPISVGTLVDTLGRPTVSMAPRPTAGAFPGSASTMCLAHSLGSMGERGILTRQTK